MTQEEKKKQHLSRQFKRTRVLIWKTIGPLVALLLLCMPLLLSAWLAAKNEPGAVFQVRYSEYYLRWTKGRLYMLETESGDSYQLPWQILENGFRDDIRNGKLRPGDLLNISTRSGLWYDWIATLSTDERSYGDLALYEEIKRDSIQRYCIAAGIFIVLGLSLSGILYAVSRDEFRQVRRLRRKYRADLITLKKQVSCDDK